MEPDHIFIFTEHHGELAASLKKFGLTEGSPNIHRGQGTACRRFFFHNSYLELAWIVNESESKSAAIAKARLFERSQYRVTNRCPFGICMRQSDQELHSNLFLFNNSWRYHPSFLPEGQFANISANEDFPKEPLIFEMPHFGLAPQNYPSPKQQPLHHQKAFKEITRISFTLPQTITKFSACMQALLQYEFLNMEIGSDSIFVSNSIIFQKGRSITFCLSHLYLLPGNMGRCYQKNMLTR